ncbi:MULTISPECIES: hypothetical protein [Acidithiobacillus]|uniref:Uncharacterized protein n=2 Tax=Acidithiobacillus TaxID=119977 RepID=A0A179BNK3_ACIFR|nr:MULTISPECIES: hypothetical protein [Acidithiobacillus]MEB8475557.1 hypothetical protein [Acidithiobacillus ferriphilus]MEB8485974.1 hypothetical protein [Acidithiobacillus ferriphilus]MEB8489621.1 hypothetical protein [Acidithiobacillus ferriphilus]MEB8492506.1 hypothetical protein [Acidithiobacillus ferriphilus]MEB8515445.1 hypothetical protein [Acidithiobacillus ferriphilus]
MNTIVAIALLLAITLAGSGFFVGFISRSTKVDVRWQFAVVAFVFPALVMAVAFFIAQPQHAAWTAIAAACILPFTSGITGILFGNVSWK